MNKNFAAMKEVAQRIASLYHKHQPDLVRQPDGSYVTACVDENCKSVSLITPEAISTETGRITATEWSTENVSQNSSSQII